MQEYVDVRGPHPVYVNGLIAITLHGWPRKIQVSQAREIARDITEQKALFSPIPVREM